MESAAINIIDSLLSADNAIAAALVLVLYLIISKQRNSTAEVRDQDSQQIHKELKLSDDKIKDLTQEVENLKTAEQDLKLKYELTVKEMTYMKEQIGSTKESIGDIKDSLRNMEISMAKIVTIVNTIAEKKLVVKDKE